MRPEHTCARWQTTGIEIETHWERRAAKLAIYGQGKLAGRGVAGIVPIWPKSPPVFAIALKVVERHGAFSEHKRSFVSDEALFSNSCCHLGGLGSADSKDEGPDNEQDSDRADDQLPERPAQAPRHIQSLPAC